VREAIVNSEIVIFATPTWLGQPSSVAKLALERMDALISETDDNGRPVAYNRVAGVVVVGNEDGAHHVISEISGALGDIGFTIPGQAWTYWNRGPGPGDDYTDTDDGHEWSQSTGRAAASNLLAVARAMAKEPVPAPPGS
jgi:multimeric flavodoxin WrbA